MVIKRIFTGFGNCHFVTFRCSGRRSLLSTPPMRQIVISVLGDLAGRNGTHVSGFVVMPDHVHATLWFDDDRRLPEMMKTWKRLSSHYLLIHLEQYNPAMLPLLADVRNGREIRAFWLQRYHEFNILSQDKLREKLDYLHFNPVKKGLCAAPEDWLWSSARWYLLQKSCGVKIEPGF